MKTYTRMDVIGLVAEETGCTVDDARKIVNKIVDDMATALVEGKKIVFVDFGVISTRVRPSRSSIHPQGYAIEIPAKRVVKFKAGKGLSERLQRGN